MLKVHTEKLGDTAVLHVHGRIVRGAEITTLRKAVFSLVGMNRVVFDLSRADVIDAGGLGALLELRDWSRGRGIKFKIVNPTRRVRQVFAMTCLDSVFDIAFPKDSPISRVGNSWCASQIGDCRFEEAHPS